MEQTNNEKNFIELLDPKDKALLINLLDSLIEEQGLPKEAKE